jgi:hypothetical protein
LVYALCNSFSLGEAAGLEVPSEVTHRYTTAELDLLCKILENRMAHSLAAYLHDELAGVLSFLNRCFASTPAYP